eukprot:1464220-Pyramimonas_sp.AAC.1
MFLSSGVTIVVWQLADKISNFLLFNASPYCSPARRTHSINLCMSSSSAPAKRGGLGVVGGLSTVLMMDAYHAGTPARGSYGPWIQAQSADVTGITPSGITPSDTLYVNGPWRAHVQQVPVPARQSASFGPMSRATTPFEIWYSTKCWEQQQPADEAPQHPDDSAVL